MTRDGTVDRPLVIKFLLEIAGMDGQASYTHENCSDIIIRLLAGMEGGEIAVNSMAFGTDALRDRKLSEIVFNDCYFSQTSLELTELNSCFFNGTRFAQLRIHDSTKVLNVTFHGCTVDGLALVDKHRECWDPVEIRRQLEQLGINFQDPVAMPSGPASPTEPDPEINDLEKIIRYFMRSTHISESVILMKLGARGQGFIDRALPELRKRRVMEEIDNRGAGDQRRFRLGVSLQKLNTALVAARGSFEHFLEQFDYL